MKLSFFCSTVLAGSLALGLAACDRGGSNSGSNGGGTTIIQTVVQAPSVSVSAKPSVTPITDGKTLCHVAGVRVQELVNATDTYWNLVVKPGGSLSDPDVVAAADKVTEVAQKVIPMLEGMIGPGIPKEIADGLHGYIDDAKEFTQAITNREDSEDINPLAKKYKSGINAFNQACYPGK